MTNNTVPSPTIRIEHLNKLYHARGGQVIRAVQDLNLTVARGQVFGFLGANGAGKTTTIKALCGLVLPSSGSLYVNGYDVRRERSQAMRQIGAVLEGTRNIYWRLSAWDNLLYFGRLKGGGGQMLRERARHLLCELELWEKRSIAVRQFSRGMQQKVAIACALITNPPIVLLDEPTLGLDIQAAQTVKTLIRSLAREEGKTVVLTTHQLDIAEALCDRVAIMRQGRLLADQPLAELLRLFQRDRYRLRLKGRLMPDQAAAFSRLAQTEADEETLLSGTIESQEELFYYLDLIRTMHLPLIAVERASTTLEDVFFTLMEREHHEEVATYMEYHA